MPLPEMPTVLAPLRRTAPLLLLALLLCACSSPTNVREDGTGAPPAALPEDEIALADVTAHLRFLASDELMGRAAGTPGGDAAARYIAEQFRAAGLVPAPGTEDFFQPVPIAVTGRDTLTAPNVAGLVRGSDPDLRDEFIVLLAHYDHVGAGLHLRGATAADSIFNGARDNGMGVVALLSAAEALAERPPARSVLFLATTAEEMGLVGSRYYAAHPLVPLEQTVFALNVDTGGYSDTSRVTVIGLGRTTADDDLRAAAQAYGLEAAPDPAPEQHLFDRSDNVSLARRGIPAPTFSPGFRSFSDPGVADYYHQPRDEADERFDFAYLRRFAQAYAYAARLVADRPVRPRWTAGDPYETVDREQ